ncbi:MAG TPA: hypothetical protein VMS73_00495 [Anaerolineaceae bacterium]|nr:hypothetical protein [Anaerolineaceae bacterium]
MKASRLQFATSFILIFLTLAACSPATTSAPTASGGSSAPLPATAIVPTSALPTATIPLAALPTAAATLAATGGCTNAYYPVLSGASWSYASTGGNRGDYTYTRTMPTVGDTGFTTSDQYSTGVNWIAKWTCQDGNLAALDAGPTSAIMTVSSYTLTSNSVTAKGYNIPASFDTGRTWIEDVTIDGTVQNSAGKTVNSQITSALNCSASGANTITVPAGKFDTVMATCVKKVVVSALIQAKITPLATNQETIIYYYAKGVGYVKSVATGGSNNETIVLTGYKIP